MSLKTDRRNKIKSFLRIQSSPVTVTEIFDALKKRMNLDVSRKTIERDMFEMAELNSVSVISGIPSKYSLNKPTEVEIQLRIEEVRFILEVIEQGSELYLKL